MPPKTPLPPEQVADFEAWVRMGAPTPATRPRLAAAAPKPRIDLEKARAFWSFRPVADPPVARGQGRVLAEGRRRPLRPGPARSRRARPGRRRRPADPDPPRHLRPDRPAADARGGRRLPGRPVARRLRAGRRPPAGVARPTASAGGGTGSTWSATPTPPGATPTSPSRRPTSTATTSSTPSTATSPTTSSSASRSPATCCPTSPRRPSTSGSIATGYLAIARRFGSSPDRVPPDDRRHDRQPRQGVPRPERRLRPLPRPQVRPDPAGGLLRPLRHLRQHPVRLPRHGERPPGPRLRRPRHARGGRGPPPATRPRPARLEGRLRKLKQREGRAPRRAGRAEQVKAEIDEVRRRAQGARRPARRRRQGVCRRRGDAARRPPLQKGDPAHPGAEVPRGFLQVLGGQPLPDGVEAAAAGWNWPAG